MSYFIYGKRTQPTPYGGPDTRFAPLTWKGVRTTKTSTTNPPFEFATLQDAEERLSKINPIPGVVLEIRNCGVGKKV